jgi:molybdopterin synthase catalytic subunit
MTYPPPLTIVHLESASFDPWLALGAFSQKIGEAGAVASFVGICRPTSHSKAPVNALLLDHYAGFTDAMITARVATEIQRFELLGCLVIHRTGLVRAGQPIVVVGCAARHRSAAFEACESLMDWLKTDAPFWKQEIGPDGTSWITPTAHDHARRERHP